MQQPKREKKAMATTQVIILSKQTIKTQNQDEEETSILLLSPPDLYLLSSGYMQVALIFPKPPSDQYFSISSLLAFSFSAALSVFSPLAGRLRATLNESAGTLSVSLHCNNAGAEFIHATAPQLTLSDLLTPDHGVPPITYSLFPLNGISCAAGLHNPLLAAQATELADGIFLAVSLNHSVGDGVSLWHFIKAWSDLSRSGSTTLPAPVFTRSYSDSFQLPFKHVDDLVTAAEVCIEQDIRECFFHFPAASVAKLKSRANAEMETSTISSLQAVMAHVWRSVTRARAMDPEEDTVYRIIVNQRSELGLPEVVYFGNPNSIAFAKATVEEVVGEGLGRTAWRLNRAVALKREGAANEWEEAWMKKPSVRERAVFGRGFLLTGTSRRFDVYGNDFGWGRPVTVRRGQGLQNDGLVAAYPGPENGSIDVSVCLNPVAMSALLEDGDFMEMVD